MICLWCFDLRKIFLCFFVNPESNLSIRSPELAQGRWVGACSRLWTWVRGHCVGRGPEAACDVVGVETRRNQSGHRSHLLASSDLVE